MVVTYHIWFGRVSGGVDVFLLISAFLLTLSFLGKVEAGRPLDLVRYWLHRFRGLLPAVVVVMLGILVATALFVPQSRWSEILSQSWSSLFYFQNWALAADSVDYYATDHSVASPLQHFWSLSVQGQVFILWPLLFAFSAFVARVARLRFRGVVLLVFGAVFAVSLAFSVHETYTNQAHAYFDTRTRLWEFAFGTLLALALPYLRPGRMVAVAAGWLGVAAMLSGGFILDVQGQFPGFVALWPLVAAALVIVAGQTGSRFGADRFLSWGPLVRMGDISYALYLWHWPVLVIYLIYRDRESVGVVGGTAIIALSLVLAYLTNRFVEKPLRGAVWPQKRKRRALVVVGVCVVLVAAPVFGWQQGLRVQADRLAAHADLNNPGAAVLLPGYEDRSDPDAPLLPALTDIVGDGPVFSEGCGGDPTEYVSICRHKGQGAGEAPAATVGVVGSSHALMWATPLLELANERNWEVISYTRGYCPLTADPAADSRCLGFNDFAVDAILAENPSFVLTTSSQTHFHGAETLDPTWIQQVERFTSQEIPVVGIRDTPRMNGNVPACLEKNPEDPLACGVAAADTLAPEAPVQSVASRGGVHLLDFTDLICPQGYCTPVIGNVIVYRDSDHLTSTFLRTTLPWFTQRLDAALSGT